MTKLLVLNTDDSDMGADDTSWNEKEQDEVINLYIKT